MTKEEHQQLMNEWAKKLDAYIKASQIEDAEEQGRVKEQFWSGVMSEERRQQIMETKYQEHVAQSEPETDAN